MSNYTERERKIDLALLIILPSILAVFALLSLDGAAFGDYSGTYVFMTQVLAIFVVMVCPLLRLKNKLYLPYWFIFVVTSVVYIHAIMLFLGFYKYIDWWDNFTHYYSSVVVTMIVFTALMMIDRYIDRISLQPTYVLLLFTFLIGFGFGSVWEVMEWLVDNIFGEAFMQYSVYDTLGDIQMDLLGALTMTIAAAIILHFKEPGSIIGDMGLDEKIGPMKEAWLKKHNME